MTNKKIIQRTYKFELRPNQEQKVLLAKHFGCVRWVYNNFLGQRKEQYKETGKSEGYYKQSPKLTQLKKVKALDWLKEVNSQSLQHALKNLDRAFKNFFEKRAGYPRFKSKKAKQSFHIPQNVDLLGSKLYIPKFKTGIKAIIHRPIKGQVRNATITKTNTGKYFVSILCLEEYTPLPKTGESIGVDLGLKDFAITSEGVKFKNHRYTKKYEKQLAKAQKHLSRKVKGSNSFEKQRRKVARIHEKIRNSRNDDLHKVSHQLIKNYDVICLEDLHIKGMVQHPTLSKHIADASWGNFVRMLQYKADWNERTIVKIDRWFASSKTCSCCGTVNQELELSDRHWTCSSCNTKLDRDVNAATNILNEGFKNISAGTVDYKSGEDVRLVTIPSDKQTSKKLEAQCPLAIG